MAPTCFPWQTIICQASFHGIVTPLMANLALTCITPYISWHINGRSMHIMYKSWLSSSDHGNIMAHCYVPLISLKPTNLSLYNGTHMFSMANYNLPCFLPWHSHAIHGKPCPDMYYTIYIMSQSWHTNGRAICISCTSHGFPPLTMVTSWRTVMCH